MGYDLVEQARTSADRIRAYTAMLDTKPEFDDPLIEDQAELDALKALHQRITEQGFTAQERADLEELGFTPDDIENVREQYGFDISGLTPGDTYQAGLRRVADQLDTAVAGMDEFARAAEAVAGATDQPPVADFTSSASPQNPRQVTFQRRNREPGRRSHRVGRMGLRRRIRRRRRARGPHLRAGRLLHRHGARLRPLRVRAVLALGERRPAAARARDGRDPRDDLAAGARRPEDELRLRGDPAGERIVRARTTATSCARPRTPASTSSTPRPARLRPGGRRLRRRRLGDALERLGRHRARHRAARRGRDRDVHVPAPPPRNSGRGVHGDAARRPRAAGRRLRRVRLDGRRRHDRGYAWDFGDGSSGTGKTASHTYTSSGTFTARLEVTDDDGGSATTTREIDGAGAQPRPGAVRRQPARHRRRRRRRDRQRLRPRRGPAHAGLGRRPAARHRRLRRHWQLPVRARRRLHRQRLVRLHGARSRRAGGLGDGLGRGHRRAGAPHRPGPRRPREHAPGRGRHRRGARQRRRRGSRAHRHAGSAARRGLMRAGRQLPLRARRAASRARTASATPLPTATATATRRTCGSWSPPPARATRCRSASRARPASSRASARAGRSACGRLPPTPTTRRSPRSRRPRSPRS